MPRLASLIAAATLAAAAAASAHAATFTDSLTPASPLWNNFAGGWTSTASGYAATTPNNNPFAETALPFQVGDLSLSVNVTNLTDGGIFLHSDGTNQNGVLLILGGEGFGNGTRGGSAGNSIYWHIVQNGSASGPMNEFTGVFTPGNNYSIQVTVTGNVYAAFINGSLTPATTLTTALFPTGQVGLYDNQPNVTTASGSGAPMDFTNFSLTAANAPEPASLGLLGLGALLLHRRRRA
jgi:MYXO-CTERM domain-containing protein